MIFSKTYKVRCPDGSIRIVYKNVDDAYPLWARNTQMRGQAGVESLLEGVKANIRVDYLDAIKGFLIKIGELNSTAIAEFRSAYIIYQANPCSGHDDLKREHERITENHNRLKIIKMHIDSIVTIAKKMPADSGQLTSAIKDLLDNLGTCMMPYSSVFQIAEAREAAKDMFRSGQDG